MANLDSETIERGMNQLTWYHTIDLGHGLSTPGIYDHRPYLEAYGLPKDLAGRRVLDIGAASGFFTFEMEKRGAQVTATELPHWSAHDFGPLYQPEMTPEQAEVYLHEPFLFAQQVLGSRARRRIINIYDISPETVGAFDLVFCGSVLLHLTDPIKALWRIRSVTSGVAIVATVIHPLQTPDPLALFVGQDRGDGWWLPNRPALEAMFKSAGFRGWEWFSEFRLDYRNGQPGPYHAVIRAWTTADRPALLDNTDACPSSFQGRQAIESARPSPRRGVGAYTKLLYGRLARMFRPQKQKA